MWECIVLLSRQADSLPQTSMDLSQIVSAYMMTLIPGEVRHLISP